MLNMNAVNDVVHEKVAGGQTDLRVILAPYYFAPQMKDGQVVRQFEDGQELPGMYKGIAYKITLVLDKERQGKDFKVE